MLQNSGGWLLGHPLHAALAGCLLAGVVLLALVLCMRGVNLDDTPGPVPAASVHRVDQLHDDDPEQRRLRPDWRTEVIAVPLPPRADEDLADTARLSWAAIGLANAVPPSGTKPNGDYAGRHHRPESGTPTW